MKTHPIFGLAVCAILATRTTGGAAQTHVALASLTVPESTLPAPCKAQPVVPRTRTMLSTAGKTETITMAPADGFPSNPWMGTDGKLLIYLKGAIDGPLRMPDAPPPSPAQVASINERWTANVVEGYRAIYTETPTGSVQVSAIRLADPKQVTSPMIPSTSRWVIGDLVVRVTNVSNSKCFQPIYDYLRSLK